MEKDRMMLALFAAHALPAVAGQMDIRSAPSIAAAAYAIADAMLAEAKRRESDAGGEVRG